jgi:hypothetical protein
MDNFIPPKKRHEKLVNVAYRPRSVVVHYVTEEELRSLADGNDSLEIAFFGISIGTCVTLLCTLVTSTFASVWTHASFVAVAWLAGASTLLFGARVLRGRIRIQKKLKELTSDSPPIIEPTGVALVPTQPSQQ